MPDQPVYKEFGTPLSKGDKTSDEVFNARYGTYKDLVVEGPSGKPASAKLDPQPFTNVKSGK